MYGLIPRALVFRLFLRPQKLDGIRVFRQLGFGLGIGERVELLDADDGHFFFQTAFGTACSQVVVNLPGAQNHAFHFAVVGTLHGITDNGAERCAFEEIGQRAGGVFEAQ